MVHTALHAAKVIHNECNSATSNKEMNYCVISKKKGDELSDVADCLRKIIVPCSLRSSSIKAVKERNCKRRTHRGSTRNNEKQRRVPVTMTGDGAVPVRI